MRKAVCCSIFALLVLPLIGYATADAAIIGPRGLEVNAGFANGEDDIGSTFILGALMDLGEFVPGLAFEGGAGTANMIKQAKDAGIPVTEVSKDEK